MCVNTRVCESCCWEREEREEEEEEEEEESLPLDREKVSRIENYKRISIHTYPRKREENHKEK